ncbi:MAG: restriction endonuclease subunit S [Bacteroidota bacterium]
MKQGWEMKRLEDCFKLKSGDGLTSKWMIKEGKYPVFGGNGIAGLHDKFNLSGSNVIIGRVGALCGNVRHMNEKIWLTDNAFRIVDFKYDFDHSFLTYLLNFKNLREHARQAAQPVISNSSLKDVTLKFPKSLSEQQRIVSILDEAFTAIAKAKANAEQNLKNAKELFESYLQSVFEKPSQNWEICNLEAYIKLIDYRGRTPVKTESGVRLITAKNVKLGYLQLEPQEFIASNNYESWMSRGIPNFGDVIFTTEAPLANIAQIDTNEKVAFAQRIIVMQPKPNHLNQTFLKYLLLSNPIRNKILDKGTGATVLGIKSSLLKKIEIYFPKSVKEQQIIVKKLDTLSTETKKLEAIYRKKIADLEELKKSILQKAFSGELKTMKAIVS